MAVSNLTKKFRLNFFHCTSIHSFHTQITPKRQTTFKKNDVEKKDRKWSVKWRHSRHSDVIAANRYNYVITASECDVKCKNVCSWSDLKNFMRQVGEVTYTDAHIRSGENRGEVRFFRLSDFKVLKGLFQIPKGPLHGQEKTRWDEASRPTNSA